MTFEPGQTVDQRYVVKQRMGGNMHGSTSKAISNSTNKEVVLKKLHHDSDQGMQQQLHLAQQAMQLSRQCDELLTIDEVSVDEDNAYYVLPYLPARSLKRRKPPVADKNTQTEDQVYFAEDFTWLPRIAKALDFLASQNHIHGDVKPTNILFAEDSNGQLSAYLSDIEIPKPRNENDAAKKKDEYPGTMAYLAREVFLDQKNGSHQSDQYSLAVTLYEWLAGELPFKGFNGIEMYKAFQTGCKPISDFCPSLPQPACDALHQALAGEPEQRFETSGEFVTAFVSSLPIQAKTRFKFSFEKASNIFLVVAASIFLLVVGSQFLRPTGTEKGIDTPDVARDREPASSTPNTTIARVDNSPQGQEEPSDISVNNGREPKKSANPNQANWNPNPAHWSPGQTHEPRVPNSPKAPTAQQNSHSVQQAAQREAKALQRFKRAQKYEAENGFQANQSQLLKIYRDLAEQGLADAQFRMGQYYENNALSIQELELAYEYYEKAALQDRPGISRYLVEFCNRHGPKDWAQKWIQTAVEQERREAELKRSQPNGDSKLNWNKQW